jgi:NADPH-dependent curcumin reductase CurA
MRTSRLICKVLDSKSDSFKTGQLVSASSGWSLYAINEISGLNIAHPLGTFSITGITV